MGYSGGLGATKTSNPTVVARTEYGKDGVVTVKIVSTAVDAGSTPTTTLRKGLVMGKITSGGKYREYLDSSSDGSQVAKGILTDEVNMLDAAGVVQDQLAVIAFAGFFDNAKVFGEDAAAKVDLTLCRFDNDF